MATELINNVLDMAKLASGNATYEQHLMSVLPTLKQLLELQKKSRNALARNITIDMAVGPSFQSLLGDPRLRMASHTSRLKQGESDLLESIAIITDSLKFKQILNNLLSNAIKFSRHGGNIIVSAQVEWHAASGLLSASPVHSTSILDRSVFSQSMPHVGTLPMSSGGSPTQQIHRQFRPASMHPQSQSTRGSPPQVSRHAWLRSPIPARQFNVCVRNSTPVMPSVQAVVGMGCHLMCTTLGRV
jgi:hypothetical protein